MDNQTYLSRIGTAVWNRRNPQWSTPPAGHEAPTLVISPRTLPRYVWDKALLAANRRFHATTGRPWITSAATKLLDELLNPSDVALEFGSGGSTEWLARRVVRLYSVEADDGWHRSVGDRLEHENIDNVTSALASSDILGYDTPEHCDAYVNAHANLPADSLGLVLVDGEYRDECALRALSLLRPGGLLVLDNANTYLHSDRTRSPWRMAEPASPRWKDFSQLVADWRNIWTTNGVWDTALWIKP